MATVSADTDKLAANGCEFIVPVVHVSSAKFKPIDLYNVEVEDYHTYFVGRRGRIAVWSHNGLADGGCGVPKPMEVAEAEQAGTGGGLRYITEEATAEMVNQEHAYSCQVACARQLLKDAGIHVSEQGLVAKIGLIEEYGTTAGTTAAALDKLHPKLGYAGGSVDPETVQVLFDRDPWIASLKTDRGTVHAVS